MMDVERDTRPGSEPSTVFRSALAGHLADHLGLAICASTRRAHDAGSVPGVAPAARTPPFENVTLGGVFWSTTRGDADPATAHRMAIEANAGMRGFVSGAVETQNHVGRAWRLRGGVGAP